MTIPRMKIKATPTAKLKIRAPVPFPADVVGTGGIAVRKAGSRWIVASDFGQLAPLPAVPDLAAKQAWVFDPLTGVYNRVALDVLRQTVAIGVASVAGLAGNVTADALVDALNLDPSDIGGLGTAAGKDVGTGAGNVAILDEAGRLPAVDGSRLTNIGQFLSVADYGARGDGATDDTSAINAALQAASVRKRALFFPSGTYRVTEAAPGAGHALLNRGVTCFGEGSATIIAPLPAMPNSADYMLINPATGTDLDAVSIRDLMIWPGIDGVRRGRRAIHGLFDGVSNVSRLEIRRVYCAPGNDHSIRLENNPATNPQGGPSGSVIEQCGIWEGLHATYVGDSVCVRNNIFRSSVGSGRPGCLLYMTDTASAGKAGHFVFEQNNVDCDGGAVSIIAGREVKILYNNIEHSHGAGSHGAVVDIDGSSGVIDGVEIRGNHVGVFGTSTASSAIRLNGTSNAIVADNVLIAGTTVAVGINVKASSTSARIEYADGEITGFEARIADDGLGTSGRIGRQTSQRVFYVRPDGSDRNSGFHDSASGAFGTIQRAIDAAVADDLGTNAATIRVAAGNYPGAVTLKSYAGVGPISIVGDIASPGNVVISTTSANAITADGVLGVWKLGGIKLQTSVSGIGVLVSNGSKVSLDGTFEIGVCAGHHFAVTTGGALNVFADYTISGGAPAHMFVLTTGQVVVSAVATTVTGAPDFSMAFACASGLGIINSSAWVVSGSATGTRYLVAMNGVINTAGGGDEFFPGSVAGSVSAGGQYV